MQNRDWLSCLESHPQHHSTSAYFQCREKHLLLYLATLWHRTSGFSCSSGATLIDKAGTLSLLSICKICLLLYLANPLSPQDWLQRPQLQQWQQSGLQRTRIWEAGAGYAAASQLTGTACDRAAGTGAGRVAAAPANQARKDHSYTWCLMNIVHSVQQPACL